MFRISGLWRRLPPKHGSGPGRGAMEGSRIDFGFATAPLQDDAMIKACQTRRQFIDVTADCGGDCGPGEAQFT